LGLPSPKLRIHCQRRTKSPGEQAEPGASERGRVAARRAGSESRSRQEIWRVLGFIFEKLKDFRRAATRYKKLAFTYQAMCNPAFAPPIAAG